MAARETRPCLLGPLCYASRDQLHLVIGTYQLLDLVCTDGGKVVEVALTLHLDPILQVEEK